MQYNYIVQCTSMQYKYNVLYIYAVQVHYAIYGTFMQKKYIL